MRLAALVFLVCSLAAAAACVGDSTTPTDGGVDATIDVLAPDASDAGGGDASDGSCGDTQTDPNNCGACGHVCSASAGGCFAGVCGNVIVQIAAGPSSFHTCALTASGNVWCWGLNSDGQLGVGSQTSFNQPAHVTKDANGGTFDSVKQLAVGVVHTCALKKDGTVWCWGNGNAGELGDGVSLPVALDGGPHDELAPRQVPSLSGFKAVSAGGYFTCGIDANSVVWCWGSNDSGSLGHDPGTGGDKPCVSGGTCSAVLSNGCCNSAPSSVAGATGVVSVSVGDFNVVTTDGVNVKAWGKNDSYQELDSPDAGAYSFTPVTVGLTFPTDTVYAGREYHCARKAADVLTCWGRNDMGMLATGDFTNPEPPVLWGGGAGFKTTSAGLGQYHACIVTGTAVKCAGADDTGGLGIGVPPPSGQCRPATQSNCFDQAKDVTGLPTTATPVQVVASSAIPSSALLGYGCALMSDGSVYCWGDNTYGELGNGTNTASTSAVQVVGLP